jgi:hypothetical protein
LSKSVRKIAQNIQNYEKKIDLQSFLLRIMRLTLVQIGMIILFTSIGFARKSNAQEILNRQVSLHIDNQDIKSILSEVEQLTSVKFMYSSEIIQVRRRVSFLAKNEKLSSVLDRLLSPLKINYEVSNKKILLTSSDKEIEKQQSSNTSEQLAPLAWEITGIIKMPLENQYRVSLYERKAQTMVQFLMPMENIR